MIRRPTTIVIGAGSSCELGLPSGAQLRTRIAQFLTRDNQAPLRFRDVRLQRAISGSLGVKSWQNSEKLENLVEAAERIEAGMSVAASIDNFLHTHHADENVTLLGKFGIAATILEAERSSLLYHRSQDTRGHYDTPQTLSSTKLQQESWLPDLARWLFTGIDRDRPEDALRDLHLIIFNYDRCVEQFLWLAFQAYFGVDEAHAAFLLGNAHIVHPYGTIGLLPWQLGETAQGQVRFGESDIFNMSHVASNIKTFTESVTSTLSTTVKHYIQSAEIILFMGYGFAEQNNVLLQALERGRAARAYATAFDLSPPDQAMIYQAVGGIIRSSAGGWLDLGRSGIPVFLENGGCRNLMKNHSLQLTLQ